MDATDAWSYLITDATELAGLPDSALSLAKQAAEEHRVAKIEVERWKTTRRTSGYERRMPKD